MSPWAAKYRVQMRQAEVPSLVVLRHRQQRVRSMLEGWPPECSEFARPILESIEAGCATARAVAERLGRPWYVERGDTPVRKHLEQMVRRGWLVAERGRPTLYRLAAAVAEVRRQHRERGDLR